MSFVSENYGSILLNAVLNWCHLHLLYILISFTFATMIFSRAHGNAVSMTVLMFSFVYFELYSLNGHHYMPFDGFASEVHDIFYKPTRGYCERIPYFINCSGCITVVPSGNFLLIFLVIIKELQLQIPLNTLPLAALSNLCNIQFNNNSSSLLAACSVFWISKISRPPCFSEEV